MLESVKNCGVGKFVSRGAWIHGERVIDSYEIIFVTKGEVFIKEADVRYHIKQNEILLLEPGLCHAGYKHSQDTEFFWLHWYGELERLKGFKHRKFEDTYNTVLYFRQMLSAKVMQRDSEYIDCLTRLVLMEVCRSLDTDRLRSANPVVERACAWIRANLCAGITEEQVAAHLGYNTDYLRRLFKSAYSKTVKQYINERRMEFIKEKMLADSLSLKEIAAAAGFSEYKYFLKFFKYHEGLTPSEFASRHAYTRINSI